MPKRRSFRRILGLFALTGVLPGAAAQVASSQPATVAVGTPALRPAEPTSSAWEHTGYLDVDGGRLHYQVAGSGLTIVLLHDGIVHSEVWDGQWRDLAADYRVVRYDRRGFGRSDAPTAAYSDAADLDALLSKLGVERAVLVGASSGGELALYFAAAHPHRVAGLVLVGTVLDSFGYSTHFVQRAYGNEGTSLDDKIARWTNDPYLVAAGNDAARARVAELLSLCRMDLDDGKYAYQQPPAAEIMARWAQLRVPALILVGVADIPDVHAHAGALEAGLVGAQRVVLRGAGHLPYLEQPVDFNRTVRGFASLVARRMDPHSDARNFESEYLRADGAVLYYEAQGAGEPLVLIHSGNLDHRMWDVQFDVFAQHHRVIRYDVRGHGLSKGLPGAYHHHEDLFRLLNHLRIPRAHLVGLSLGGRIAIDFALEHPEMVGGLIPVAPGLSGFVFGGTDLLNNAARMSEAFRTGDYDSAREFMQRSWTDGPKRTSEQVDPAVRAAVRNMLNWSLQPGRDLGTARPPQPPAAERLTAIRAPTLVIQGALDMSDVLKVGERLVNDIPMARQTIVPDVAHMVNMERPSEFAQLVLEFLAAHPMAPEKQSSP